MSKRCQIVKKSDSWTREEVNQRKKSDSWTREEVNQRKNLSTMRFTHNDINFDVTCESHQNWSKIYFMNILRVSMNIKCDV